MKIICFSFSQKGGELADRLVELAGENTVDHYRSSENKGQIRALVAEGWNEYDSFIFIGASGIAIRYISSYVRDKRTDPAVIVIDDMGRFVISLLSGHLGGANELSLEIAEKIGAIPVITTASDGRGIESVDMFAKKNNYHMESMVRVKDLTALMVDGKKIGFYSEEEALIDYDGVLELDGLEELDEKKIEGLIVVSSRTDLGLEDLGIPVAILRPRNINVGIGCRRGMEFSRILQALEDSLEELKLSINSVGNLGTVDVKKDEPGILELGEHLKIPLHIFTREEIAKVDHMFSQSDFVKKTIGVYNVSEPAAYLLGKEMLLEKSRHNGITISISRGGNNE